MEFEKRKLGENTENNSQSVVGIESANSLTNFDICTKMNQNGVASDWASFIAPPPLVATLGDVKNSAGHGPVAAFYLLPTSRGAFRKVETH